MIYIPFIATLNTDINLRVSAVFSHHLFLVQQHPVLSIHVQNMFLDSTV